MDFHPHENFVRGNRSRHNDKYYNARRKCEKPRIAGCQPGNVLQVSEPAVSSAKLPATFVGTSPVGNPDQEHFMRNRAPTFIEPLESRRHLSGTAYIVGDFAGAAVHGNTSFAVTIDITTEDRHGLIVGTAAIRFSKHDAPVYSFVGRVIRDKVTIDIPTHNVSFDGAVNTRTATISGIATDPQGSANFSAVLET
jgi:hypothetical protein